MIDIFSYMLGQKAGGGGSGGGGDWNASEGEAGYIKNRTHYEDKAFEPIVWDASKIAEYEETFSWEDGFDRICYKVADYFPVTTEQVSSLYMKGTMEGQLIEQEVPLDMFGGVTQVEHGWLIADGTFIGSDGQYVNINDVTVPEGIWVRAEAAGDCLVVNPATTVKPLDEKYLPDTVATKADIFGAMEASY